jgi:hypothetical protein
MGHRDSFIFTFLKSFPLTQSLIKHQAMKTYGGVEVHIRAFLILALDGDEY